VQAHPTDPGTDPEPIPERTAILMSKGNARAKQIKGKLKETLGKTVGDKSMAREGRGEQLRGKAQEMAEKAAERVRKATKH
jgi:uncharacterized protein YjbJ (UPF0337 family)